MPEYVKCDKCETVMSENRTGLCRPCRTVECKRCGKKWSTEGYLKSGFTLCAKCRKSTNAEARREL